MREGYFIGVDSGTSGIKAVAFDMEGRELAVKRRSLKGITPCEDWYEQDMEVIWENCCACLKGVLSQIEAEKVLGIGITAQGDGLWMIDGEGKPVRPGICFCDGRTKKEIDAWREDGILEKAFDICGTAVFGSAMSAEIRWMEKNMPECLERAACFFHLKDWLFYKMTGVVSCDDTDMSIPLLNVLSRDYDDRLFCLYGIGKYREKFPKVYPTRENKSNLLPELAKELGLREEVLVVGGPMDIPACALGCGAIEDGQACTVIGTAAIHSVIMDRPRPEPYMAGMTIAHCLPDRWIRLVSSLGGAPNLEWFLRTAGKRISLEAQERGVDIYSHCSELVDQVPIGSNGVVYHPYLMAGGERAPFFKGNIKASFAGISFNTTLEDMLRAVYEGIAMAMVDCYQSVPVKLSEIYVSGGGAKSDVWMQMFADAMGTDVVILCGTELGAKGAAMNAAVALGTYGSYREAVKAAVRERKRFHPREDRHRRYAELYLLYKRGYELSMEWWDERSKFLQGQYERGGARDEVS